MRQPTICPRCEAPIPPADRTCPRCAAPRRLFLLEYLTLALFGLLPLLGFLLASYYLFAPDPFEKKRGGYGLVWAMVGAVGWGAAWLYQQ